MLPVAYYLLKVMICSGIMYCYYLLALRNKRFHQYNRFYLLFAVSLSFIIPFIKVEFWKETARQSAVMKAFTIVNYTDAYIAKQTPFIWDWESIAFTAFVFISFTFLLSLIVSLIKIFAIIKRHPKKFLDKVCFVFSDTPGSPFSFFKYIFWNREIDIESDTGKQMLKHELVHVHEKHSADKLFLNLMLVIGWYNPFIWLVRRELNMIHEFIADQKAVSDGEVNSLALMLLQSTYPSHSFMFVNSFFHSPIKRRLIMLSKTHKPRFSYLSRLIMLPLLIMVFAFFAFKFKEDNKQRRLTSFNKLSQQGSTSQNEEPAQFPGGLHGWKLYLLRNADLNVLAEHNAPVGTYAVVISFNVSTDGSISSIVTETNPGYGTEEEAIKLISKGPKWQPAKKDGAFVVSQVKQTISFTLTKQGALVTVDSILVS